MTTPPSSRRRRTLTLLAGFGLLVLIVAAGRTGSALVPQFVARVEALGALGPVVFIAGYAFGVVVGLPGSLLTLAAGATFGLVAGTAWAFTGAVLGASIAFLLARFFLRGAVARRFDDDDRFAAIDGAIAAEGRRTVFLLRLSPVFPFTLLNYLLGITRVRFTDYLVASVGMLPGTLLYVYTGKIVGDVASVTAGSARPSSGAYYAVLALGLAATAAVAVFVTRAARRALAEAAVATRPEGSA